MRLKSVRVTNRLAIIVRNAIVKSMLNSRIVSQFIIILISAIISIVIGINARSGNLDLPNNARTPEVVLPIPSEKIESPEPESEVAKLPTKTETKAVLKAPITNTNTYKTTQAFEQYKPKYFQANIDPSNYGDRYSTDVNGNTLDNSPIVVLHETTNSLTSAINTFTTPHYHDSHQVSYHALIALDGTIVYLVPSEKRAFGAGNSVFTSPQGLETVKTNPNLPSSVNNFAYHISLETPPDGHNQQSQHSGYTDSQYKSLAWLLALSSIPDDRITTHQNVDRSGNRFDPRSFDFDKFFQILHTYRQPTTVEAGTSTE